MARQVSNLTDSFISVDSRLDDLSVALDNFEKNVQGTVLLSGVAAMAKVVYDEVRINAEKHRKTGLLYDNIYRFYAKERSNEFVKTYFISVRKGPQFAPHWHFLEYGTSKEPARPFIRPAFDHIQEAIQAGKDRMAQRLSEIAK